MRKTIYFLFAIALIAISFSFKKKGSQQQNITLKDSSEQIIPTVLIFEQIGNCSISQTENDIDPKKLFSKENGVYVDDSFHKILTETKTFNSGDCPLASIKILKTTKSTNDSLLFTQAGHKSLMSIKEFSKSFHAIFLVKPNLELDNLHIKSGFNSNFFVQTSHGIFTFRVWRNVIDVGYKWGIDALPLSANNGSIGKDEIIFSL